MSSPEMEEIFVMAKHLLYHKVLVVNLAKKIFLYGEITTEIRGCNNLSFQVNGKHDHS